MAIRAKSRSTEAQGYSRGYEDSHPSLSSRPVIGHVTHHPHSEKAANLGRSKAETTPRIAGTLLQGLGTKLKYLRAQEGFRRAPLLTVFRLILWRARCLLAWPATITLGRSNVRMFLPARWRGIEKIAFAFREDFEPELSQLKKVLSPGEIFVDVGACYGIYALIASTIVGRTGRVIAFEPSTRAFPILQKNISLNNLTNVRASCLALSDKSGRTYLYHHPNVGCDSLAKDDSFTESVQETVTETLDNVIRELGIGHVDVIKMDVQGAEEWVLRGAIRTLTSTHPIVIFESWPAGPPLLGLSPNGAWDLLGGLGYEFYILEVSGSLINIESLPPVDCNIVAIHRQSR
jgi:FkbM family methyltransferase